MSKISASRISTINRVYLIITLFVTLIFCLVLLIQVQMDTLSAIRAYVGGEGLWAKAQKDAVRSLEHYALSRDEADYLAYRRQIQVPLGDMKARIELQKKNPDLTVVLAGFVQGRNHPDDMESAVRFFRRFQHSAYMSQVVEHWTAGDRMIVELNGVAEALHEEIASGRNNHKVIRAYHIRLDDINRQVTVEENLFSSTLAEASRWANNVSRNLTYAIALLFVALGAGLSWPIITRIRRTENDLVESEGRYRGIFEEVGDIIYTIEADGRISSLSPAFERLTGWLPGEWVGQPFANIIHRDDLPQALEIFRKTILGEATSNVEVRIHKKSGAYFDADHRVVPILGSGKSVVLLGIARDISERKRAEESVRINQSRFSTIFNQAPLGIALIDSFTGEIYEVNPRFAEITGRTLEEMASIDWMSLTYPDDVQKDLDNMALLNAGKIPGFRMDKRYIRPDGSIVWVNMTIAPLKNGSILPRHLCMIDDITEDKLAAEALRKANVDLSLFRKLLDNSSDAIEVIEPVTSRFIDVNETACRTLGYSREELLAMSIFDIDPSFSLDTKKMIDEQVQKSGAARYEGMHRRKDGSSFAVEVSIGTANLDKLYVLCVVRDITERKLAEEKIRKQQELTTQIIETIPLRVFWKDRDLRYLGCNTLFAKDAGLTHPDELIGKTDFDMGWKDQAEIYRADDSLVMDSNTPKLSFDEPQTTPEGAHIWLRTSKVPLRSGVDETIGLLGVYEDITDYKQVELSLLESEERFRKAFQHSAIGMALVGLDGHWLKVNHSLCQIVGYSEQELLSKTFQDLTHPDDLQSDLEFLAQLLAGEIDHYQMEKRYFHKDGHVVWIRLSVSLIWDAQNNPIHFVAQIEDISEDKLAEEKIRKLNEELEAKVQRRSKQLREAQEELVRKEKLAVLGQVAGSVGHELRNPLGVMSNAVYFLQTVLSDADETTKEYLNIIKDEIAGSERIVSDLLDSVRTKPPQIQTVGITELIEQTLRKYIVPSSVTVKLDIPATLPPLRVDAMQIQQVLRNLISNGVEAMPEGGTLEIHAVENKQDGTVTVSVRDSGIGMAPEVLPKLFQPLFTTKARGIGLGLVVVKNLTQANGGRVEVQSELGKGTTFAVILPV